MIQYQVPQQEDGLTALSRLLNVVQSGQQIYKGFKKSPDEQKSEDDAAGKVSPTQLSEYQSRGGVISESETPGSTKLVNKNTGKDVFITYPTKSGERTTNLQPATYTDASGKTRQGAFNPATGEYLQSEKDPLGKNPDASEKTTWKIADGVSDEGGQPLYVRNTGPGLFDAAGRPYKGTTSKNSSDKAPTTDQSKAGTFSKRAEAADAIAADLNAAGYSPTYKKSFKEAIPFGFGNSLLSKDDQSYNQAKTDFISAVLRLESGAAISDKEYAKEEQKYFPQPGDDPKTVEQKSLSRRRAIEGLVSEAGPAYAKVKTVPNTIAASSQQAPGTAQAATGQAPVHQNINGVDYLFEWDPVAKKMVNKGAVK